LLSVHEFVYTVPMNIILRPYKQTDLDSLVHLANDEDISRWMNDSFPYPYTYKDAEWWISVGTHNGYSYAIEADGQYAGGIGIQPQTGMHRHTAEVGYWLGRPFWGKGIASKAVVKITKWAWQETELIRLYANVYQPNSASMRVLEKSNYQLESIAKQAILKRDELYDIHQYVALRSEWQAPQ